MRLSLFMDNWLEAFLHKFANAKSKKVMACWNCGSQDTELVGTAGWIKGDKFIADGETWLCHNCGMENIIYLNPEGQE